MMCKAEKQLEGRYISGGNAHSLIL